MKKKQHKPETWLVDFRTYQAQLHSVVREYKGYYITKPDQKIIKSSLTVHMKSLVKAFRLLRDLQNVEIDLINKAQHLMAKAKRYDKHTNY